MTYILNKKIIMFTLCFIETSQIQHKKIYREHNIIWKQWYYKPSHKDTGGT